VRATFEALAGAAAECGPVTIYAQKSRIVFMVRVRFGGVITRKKWLYFSLWLRRRAKHPTLNRIEDYGSGSFGHQFKLNAPDQVDDALKGLICESFRVGRQEHLHG
jgi:hypothetical protein